MDRGGPAGRSEMFEEGCTGTFVHLMNLNLSIGMVLTEILVVHLPAGYSEDTSIPTRDASRTVVREGRVRLDCLIDRLPHNSTFWRVLA